MVQRANHCRGLQLIESTGFPLNKMGYHCRIVSRVATYPIFLKISLVTMLKIGYGGGACRIKGARPSTIVVTQVGSAVATDLSGDNVMVIGCKL